MPRSGRSWSKGRVRSTPRSTGARAFEAVYLGADADAAFAPLVARVARPASRSRRALEGGRAREGRRDRARPSRCSRSRRCPTRRSPTCSAADGLVLVGVALADPGNLGTLMRSAEAAGAAVIVLGPGSVDAYNPKVVRASAGAIFGVRGSRGGWSAVEVLDALGELGRAAAAAPSPPAGAPEPRSTSRARPRSCSATRRTASTPTSSRARRPVTIPMAGAGRVAQRRDGRHRAAASRRRGSADAGACA